MPQHQTSLTNRSNRSRGMALIYVALMLVVLAAFASLAVDLGRVQVAKTELRRSADAASRYGAAGIPTGITTVQANAIAAANDNTADGYTVTIQNSDVEFGTWSTSAKTFTVLTGNNRNNANSVRITTRRTAATSTAIPMTFAKVLGKTSCDVTAQSIAMYVAPVNVSLPVPATSCPWLAGAASGTVANSGNPHNNPDYAPSACPQLESGVPLTAGQSLQFSSINGGANNFSSSVNYTPDGNTDWITDNYNGNENGLSDLTAPINCVVGVFLDGTVPSSNSGYPSALDFTTSDERDFGTLTPLLRQPFFIGDGLRNDGVTKQNFVVPQGATRLYIGTMDGYEWNNNQGSYTTTIVLPAQVQLVK